MHVKIYSYNEQGDIIIEDYHNVEKFHYEQRGKEGNYLFLVFEEDSPNYKRFKPHGECAVEINKDDAFAVLKR